MIENKDNEVIRELDETIAVVPEINEEIEDNIAKTKSEDVTSDGKKKFDWSFATRVLSWLLFALIIIYNGFNAYSSIGMSKLYLLLYVGIGLFYGCLVLFGMNVIANIADNTAKCSIYLKKLTEQHEESTDK